MNASVAGAPVSFGVYEMTPEGADTIAPDTLLAVLAPADYVGVDLGPVGYLGEGTELQGRLRRHNLELAGGWVQLPLSDDDAFAASLPELHNALRVFAAAADTAPARLPVPTLADSGSEARRAAPGHGAESDPIAGLAWDRLIANTERAAKMVRAAGFEPTFHHHAGTFVESTDEIDHFLANADVGLTLDVGHLAIAGGDPVDAIRRWGSRINHLHLKDVNRAAVEHVLAAGGGMPAIWSSGAFTAFGDGDIDLVAVMNAMADINYDGWIVVEQDVLNPPGISLTDFQRSRGADQITNRQALRAWVETRPHNTKECA